MNSDDWVDLVLAGAIILGLAGGVLLAGSMTVAVFFHGEDPRALSAWGPLVGMAAVLAGWFR